MTRSRNSTRSRRHRLRVRRRGNYPCTCWLCMPIVEKKLVLRMKRLRQERREEV